MNSSAAILKVFVYGTLKPGEANYQNYCQGKTIAETPAYTRGELYQLSPGYPGMCQGNRKITGYLLEFAISQKEPLINCSILQELDRLEDYQENRSLELNEYYRIQPEIYSLDDTSLGNAWCYFMTKNKIIQLEGQAILTNQW